MTAAKDSQAMDLFSHAPPPRAHARTADPHTSHAAARAIKPSKLRASQAAIMTLLEWDAQRGGAGLTDERLGEMYRLMRDVLNLPRQSASGLRTRRAELTARGFVQDSGEHCATPSGRRAIVWRLRRRPDIGSGVCHADA